MIANIFSELSSIEVHLRFPIGPVELIAVDGKSERVGAGGDGFLLLGVNGDAVDALEASVGVAQAVSLPVDGQRVW